MSNAIAQDAITDGTIKHRLLKAIRGGEQDPNVLGHLFGLNGHDLVKNLEQLRKEGFIDMRWGAGDRVTRVRPRKSADNMRLLQGHVGEDKALHGPVVLKLSEAIGRLPWDGEWRKWEPEEIQRLSGLSNSQIAGAMKVLREGDRVVQLGGGHRGVPIRGVRWRGESRPVPVEAPHPVESVTETPQAAPEPSGDVERFPVTVDMLARWRKMVLASELLKQTGNEGLAEELGESPEWKIMALLGHELEALLKEAGRYGS